LFIDWIQDNPDFWSPITEAITKGYQAHADMLADAKKK